MILLDSHTFLWLLHTPDRIGPIARERIGRSRPVYVSSLTQTEFMIKVMAGRLTMPERLFDDLGPLGFTSLPYTTSHAQALERFPELARHDPFDRMLLAQAHAEGVSFLTADTRLLKLGRESIVDATR